MCQHVLHRLLFLGFEQRITKDFNSCGMYSTNQTDEAAQAGGMNGQKGMDEMEMQEMES